MSNNKRNSGIFGKGYYIALILCAVAIGITGYVYNRNTQEPDSLLQQEVIDNPQLDETQDNVPAVATQPQKTDPTQPSGQPTAPVGKKPMKTTAPVSGETVAGYAVECLSYNQTTRDWRTHNGVDIGAEAGTQVVAAADGVVYTTYVDDLMGTTVVIRHEDGYVSCYASLAEELSVSAGDQVTVGQVIGTVGETALIENAIGPHVHFSVTHDDEKMDPAEFLALGQ